jgi:transposase-like protein
MEYTPRRKLTREFKLEVVRQVALSEKPKAQLARELGVPVGQLRTWRLEFEKEAVTGIAKPDRSAAEDLEQLRRENAVDECDAQIHAVLAALTAEKASPSTPLPKARHRTVQPNAVSFDVRPVLYQLAGVDVTQIHGIGPYLALRMIAECGTDLSRWRSAKHFTSWLTLSPGCKISGGKVLSAHTRKTANRVAAHLRLAAVTVGRTNTALGAFYRRLAARIGKAKAVTATARKIAVLFYNAMRFGIDYQDRTSSTGTSRQNIPTTSG